MENEEWRTQEIFCLRIAKDTQVFTFVAVEESGEDNEPLVMKSIIPEFQDVTKEILVTILLNILLILFTMLFFSPITLVSRNEMSCCN